MHRIQFHDGYWYCYANSTAMLLSSIGENISPHLIEAITGVGIGVMYSSGSGLTFISGATGEPDIGISKALTILGFSFDEYGDFSEPPFEQLETVLAGSPVIVGPLDMHFLSYNPDRPTVEGVDHYVLVYKYENGRIYLNDPAGYANVFIDKEQFTKAWKAEKIDYKRGSFRFWTNPKRTSTPNREEIVEETLTWYKQLYKSAELKAMSGKIINKAAFLKLLEDYEHDMLKEYQISFLTGFTLPLGVKRAIDIGSFLQAFHKEISELFYKKAEFLGKAQSFLMYKERTEFVSTNKSLADLEEEIKRSIIKIGS